MGIAQTGTGKTAVFVLPILQRMAGELKAPIPGVTRTKRRADRIAFMLSRNKTEADSIHGNSSRRTQLTLRYREAY